MSEKSISDDLILLKLENGDVIKIRNSITFGEMSAIDAVASKGTRMDENNKISFNLDVQERLNIKIILTFARFISNSSGESPFTEEKLLSLNAKDGVELLDITSGLYASLKKKPEKTEEK